MPEDQPEAEPPEDDDDEDLPLRWYVIAAYMVAVAAGFAVAVWYTVSWYSTCDDGRHSSPFVAGDSVRGTLCNSGHQAAGLLVAGGWLVGLVLATLALARWGGGRVRAVLFAALFLSPVALPPAAYAGLRMSSPTCSGEKLEVYGAWVEAGSKGRPPYDCRTF
jgi:hypothetical protein